MLAVEIAVEAGVHQRGLKRLPVGPTIEYLRVGVEVVDVPQPHLVRAAADASFRVDALALVGVEVDPLARR